MQRYMLIKYHLYLLGIAETLTAPITQYINPTKTNVFILILYSIYQRNKISKICKNVKSFLLICLSVVDFFSVLFTTTINLKTCPFHCASQIYIHFQLLVYSLRLNQSDCVVVIKQYTLGQR